MDLQNEWKLLTEIVNCPDTCEGYIPTLWEITRWISANEGKLFFPLTKKSVMSMKINV